jgi:hypothetical protein
MDQRAAIIWSSRKKRAILCLGFGEPPGLMQRECRGKI